MAQKFTLFPLCFLFAALLTVHGCSALIASSQQQDQLWQPLRRQQQHRLRPRTDCDVDSLTAQEPTIRFESEAGRTDFWDRSSQQFQCAGVAAVRNVIQPRGLLLPHYNNAPQILYVVQGRGIQGTVIPGCAETFESETQPRSEETRRFLDRHQKVRQFRQGDVLALPAGTTLWFYNDGNEPLVTVALLDASNEANQLDQTFRNFFLAGKPQGGSQTYYMSPGERAEEERGRKNNIFNGFDDQILAQAFNVDIETARRLKGQYDTRGQIVRAENFNVVLPRYREDEERRGLRGPWPANGLEETFCTARMRENLDQPSRAEVYNPRAGRLSSLNSQKLPILSWLRLSAEKGVLYRDAIMAPHWNVNAHAAIYVTRGRGRFQVVNHAGKSVFNGDVREGQMIIVPQNFVVLKKASEDEGLEWISFKTNDNAVTSQLAGRLSTIRALPEEVLMNSYDISREDARNLKYGRDESRMFSSTRRSYGYVRSNYKKPLEYALNVIKAMM